MLTKVVTLSERTDPVSPSAQDSSGILEKLAVWSVPSHKPEPLQQGKEQGV